MLHLGFLLLDPDACRVIDHFQHVSLRSKEPSFHGYYCFCSICHRERSLSRGASWVVRYAHSTLGSSFAHQPFESSNLFFRPFTRFRLTVALWIRRSRIHVDNSQFRAVAPKGFAIKLQSIVWYKDPWHTKSCHNILPNESLHISILDIGKWLCFHPLGEIICLDQESSSTSHGLWKRSHYV